MLDPGFWASSHNERLIFRQRLLFLGLISNADDEGRVKGNLNFIRALIFPYDDIESNQIEDDLVKLMEEGLIIRYIHKGLAYIQIAKWQTYQRIDKPTRSILPPCPEFPDIPPNDSKNESENDSKNDSKNSSENDSCLIEKKGSKEKRKEGNDPPSLNEVLVYAAQADIPESTAKAFYYHFQAKGWVTSGIVQRNFEWRSRLQQWWIDEVKQYGGNGKSKDKEKIMEFKTV